MKRIAFGHFTLNDQLSKLTSTFLEQGSKGKALRSLANGMRDCRFREIPISSCFSYLYVTQAFSVRCVRSGPSSRTAMKIGFEINTVSEARSQRRETMLEKSSGQERERRRSLNLRRDTTSLSSTSSFRSTRSGMGNRPAAASSASSIFLSTKVIEDLSRDLELEMKDISVKVDEGGDDHEEEKRKGEGTNEEEDEDAHEIEISMLSLKSDRIAFENIIQAAFEVCDWDGNGVLLSEDMITVGAILGQSNDSDLIKQLVRRCDEITDGVGEKREQGGSSEKEIERGMDFRTFRDICTSLEFSIPGDRSGTGIRALRRAFEELDVDGSYSLERDEIARALKRLIAPMKLTDRDLHMLLTKMDKDGDGVVSWQEFVLALVVPRKDDDPVIWKLFTIENLNYTPCHLADVGESANAAPWKE